MTTLVLLAAHLTSNPRMSMPPVSDGGTEVTLVGGMGRFVRGMHWPRKGLPNVEGVADQMAVTGHGCVSYALRTQSGRVLCFLLCARLVPGLQFELTSEHAMALEGLEVSRKTDLQGIVRGYVKHRASGETAQLTAHRKLFCLSNVHVDPAHFESRDPQRKAWVRNDATFAAVAGKATVDMRKLETKMGFLSPNDSQMLCTKWGVTLSRKGHVPTAINHIAKGTKVPVKTVLRSNRDAAVGEHMVCDPMGDSFAQSKAGNRALHGVTDYKRRLHFHAAHARMNGKAAIDSVEEFIRWANLPFATGGKVLNDGSTIHVDGAKHYGTQFTENFEYHGFKIWVASKYLKLSNRMYVIERMHRTVQARARAFLQIAAPVLRAEGLQREDFYDHAACHAGDVCNFSPSSHYGGGCPIAEMLGAEPTMVQTDQAVPAPWGCYCFPLMSPGADQKQMADRREPALYMRTLPDGRHLCWRLNRGPGQQKWIKTRDVVFSWAGLELGLTDKRGYRPLSEDELDAVDWRQAWEQRRAARQGDKSVVVDAWEEVNDYNEEDDLPTLNGADALSDVDKEIGKAESVGFAPLDFSFQENDGSVLPETPMPQWKSPPVVHSSPVTSSTPNFDNAKDIADASVNTIDLGGVLYQSTDGGVPVFRLEAASTAMAAMQQMLSAPWDYPELAEPSEDCWLLDANQLSATCAMAGVEGGEAVPMLTYQDLKIFKQDAKPLPKNLKTAISLPGAAGALWRRALKSEQDSYKENGAYTLVQRKHVPRGTKLYRFVNVIDRKHDSDTGLIAKLKVRLALMGNDMDAPFEQRHAAVPRTSSIRMLEMIATEGNLWRWDSDTVTAFLQGEFQHGEKGQLFCMPPFHMTELDPDGRPHLWSLNKAVHGTRQAASAHVDTMEQWLFNEAPLPLTAMQEDCKAYRFSPEKLLSEPRFARLRVRCKQQWPGWEDRWLAQQGVDVVPPATALRAAGYETAEPRQEDDYDRPMYSMCAHTDDMRHHATCKWMHEELFAPAFRARFKSTHSDGALNKPGSEQTSSHLNQRWRFGDGRAAVDNEFWIMKFLEEQGFGNCKPSDIPMPEGLKFSKAEMPTTTAEEEMIFNQLLAERKVGPGSAWPTVTTFAAVRTKYRSVTAGMGWASQTTHPELQGPVSMWASQMANPSCLAIVALPRGLRYLQKTKSDALVHTRTGKRTVTLSAQSDASLGSDSGSGTSQYGFWMSANGSAVTESRAARTKMVCSSATHTEIVSLSECCRSLVALRRFLIELGFRQDQPSVVECDNEMAIRLSKVKTNSEKSRTIRLRDLCSRECVSTGQVEVRFLSGDKIDADVFTKAKGNPAFAKMTARLKHGSAGMPGRC